jgi:hypothetical protein
MQPGRGRVSHFRRSSGWFWEAGSALEGVSNVRGLGLVWSFEGPIRHNPKHRSPKALQRGRKEPAMGCDGCYSQYRREGRLFALPFEVCEIGWWSATSASIDRYPYHLRPKDGTGATVGAAEERDGAGHANESARDSLPHFGITGTASVASGSHPAASGDETPVNGIISRTYRWPKVCLVLGGFGSASFARDHHSRSEGAESDWVSSRELRAILRSTQAGC